MYNQLKKMKTYKEAKVVGVFVPTKKKFLVKRLFQKMINDNKTLVFISTNNEEMTFRIPTPLSFNEVGVGHGVNEISKAYREAGKPDIVLLECNAENRSIYNQINNYDIGETPVIGIITDYEHPSSKPAIVNFSTTPRWFGNKDF